jgi:hypothetical protein
MSTCNRLDLETLGSQLIMLKNLPRHCTLFEEEKQVFERGWTICLIGRFKLNMVFNVTVLSFWMTLHMNKFTKIVVDDGWVHLLAKTIPSLVSNL